MRLKMEQTIKGSPDGIVVLEYLKDKEYEVPESLAKTFLKLGFASLIDKEVGEYIEKYNTQAYDNIPSGRKKKEEK